MRTKIIHFGEKVDNKAMFDMYLFNGKTNNESRKNMKSFVLKAIDNELTPMQRTCIVEHYLNGKKQKDIAFELNLNCSTVCRHINAAKKKLRHIAMYYTNVS